MATTTSTGGVDGSVVCVAVPLGLAALLNAVIRPALADALGGVARASGAGIRSHDVWWGFDAATREAHPLLTAFLGCSHGTIGIAAIVLVILLLACRGVMHARRRRASPRMTTPPR